MEEILKNAKVLPNSRLYLQAEAVQTIDTGYHGPLPPGLMDQLAAAAAASYVGPPPPGPTPQPQQHHPPQVHTPMRTSNLVDASVQTDVTTVVQSKQYLRRHVRVHTGERPYRCVVCSLTFRRSHHLRRHELMHTDIRPFSCHACDKAFKQKQHLERHLACHTDVRMFPCSICPKAFKMKEHLERHLTTHSDVRMFQCSLCNKAFKMKEHLKIHLTTHSDVRMYPCSLCNKSFKMKQHLERHLTIHSDVRMYACTICNKAFKQKQVLDKHLTVHSDLKPYACSLCEKAFKQKQHLDRHLQSHSGEKPYGCNMCEKAFTRKQHLDRHIKMHTGELERTYKCHVCEKMFFRSHHRDKHLKSHGIAALETKNRGMNFMNIDLSKGTDAMNASSPHSGSSDSGSETDDDQKPNISDKPNSQVSKMVEGCRKRKTHSPVRLAPGDKKGRITKANASSNTGTNTPGLETNGQQTPGMGNQRAFDYGGMRNDIVFPRNEAVMMRDSGVGTMQASTSTDMQSHPMGNGQGMDQLQSHQQQQGPPQQQQHFAMGMNMGLTAAQLQQLQQQMAAGQRPDLNKVDGSTQHQDGPAKTPQPLVVPSSHFASSSSKMPDLQQPKYTSAAAAIAGRQLQQAGVGGGLGVVEQQVHFKPVVGAQNPPHQAWPPTLNWPPRLSLMPDGSLQGMPTLTTYGTVNMADLNQVSAGAAMYTAQKAMEMRMAAGLHRSPSLGGDAWVPVSGSDRDGQRGGPSANDRRIYSPQPNT